MKHLEFKGGKTVNNIGQAKLYYLYMMSDGDISAGEKKLFNKICKELCLETEDKKRIRQECNEIIKKEKRTCIEVIKKNMEEPLIYGVLNINFYKYISKEDRAKILWNLVNLGYADSYFTSNEKEIVDFIREYWKIPDNLYQEMIDIAETCLALEQYKSCLEELPDTDYKKKKIKQVKKDLKYVQEMVIATISEINF